jgi:hypothetical protein
MAGCCSPLCGWCGHAVSGNKVFPRLSSLLRGGEVKPAWDGLTNRKERNTERMKHKLVKETINDAKGNIEDAMRELSWAFERVNSIVSMDGYDQTGYRKDQPQQMLKEILNDFSTALFQVSFLNNLVSRLEGQILLDQREKSNS